jgi:hypothetical protein
MYIDIHIYKYIFLFIETYIRTCKYVQICVMFNFWVFNLHKSTSKPPTIIKSYLDILPNICCSWQTLMHRIHSLMWNFLMLSKLVNLFALSIKIIYMNKRRHIAKWKDKYIYTKYIDDIKNTPWKELLVMIISYALYYNYNWLVRDYCNDKISFLCWLQPLLIDLRIIWYIYMIWTWIYL